MCRFWGERTTQTRMESRGLRGLLPYLAPQKCGAEIFRCFHTTPLITRIKRITSPIELIVPITKSHPFFILSTSSNRFGCGAQCVRESGRNTLESCLAFSVLLKKLADNMSASKLLNTNHLAKLRVAHPHLRCGFDVPDRHVFAV